MKLLVNVYGQFYIKSTLQHLPKFISWILCLPHSVCFWSISLISFPKKSAVRFSLVPQSRPTLCDPMDCSMPGFPVHHQLQELAQTHVHQVSDTIQPSHPLSSSSAPAFSLSQLRGLFTYQPEECIFQSHIFLPFHTVYGVPKARILKWFAIPFSSGPCFFRTLHHDQSILGGPTQHGS